ncbi:MAG TPA: SEC-C domain-containing protein [Sporolactobacillaceae bacterium]|nr:SEC-C domain-containing protein [Sporolactobacillaceae bacterium]
MTVKRNDPCPCGSGKKYKACCLEKETLAKSKPDVSLNSSEYSLNAKVPIDDRLILERLGIRPRLADRFYVKDLVQFYKVSVDSSPSPEKKEQAISQSLALFVDYLEHQRLSSWEACDEGFWNKLLVFSQLDLAYEQSESKVQAFIESMRTLSKWLTAQGIVRNAEQQVTPLIDQLKEDVLHAVRFLEEYHENVENPFLTGYSDLRRETLIQEAGHTPIAEGVFEVKGRDEDTFISEALLTHKMYRVHIPEEIGAITSIRTTFIGVIKEATAGQWEILALDRVFPPQANAFLRQAIGVQA